MPRRLEQLNQELRQELANLIIRLVPISNGLITISFVACSADLKQAKIGISVLPEHLASICLEKLKQHSSQFCQILRKRLKIRHIPRFYWQIDQTEKNAAEIENLIKKIKKEGL